jgi:hypothetical protein
MTTQQMTLSTFLERMQPMLAALPEGPDKDKLLALIEAQDTVERSDLPPRERARALRRLTQIDGTNTAAPGQGRERGRPA